MLADAFAPRYDLLVDGGDHRGMEYVGKFVGKYAEDGAVPNPSIPVKMPNATRMAKACHGGSEETTTGVHWPKDMAAQEDLLFIAIDVDDSVAVSHCDGVMKSTTVEGLDLEVEVQVKEQRADLQFACSKRDRACRVGSDKLDPGFFSAVLARIADPRK